jgi:DNA-directed RNA polymerase specialized sigma24 family protein
MACVTNAVRSAIRKTASLPRALPESDAIASEEQVDWDAAWKQSAIEEAVSRLRAQYHDNPTFQAFEAVVLRGQPPEVVAGALGMSRDSVYQAKARLLAKMRVELESVEREMEQQ